MRANRDGCSFASLSQIGASPAPLSGNREKNTFQSAAGIIINLHAERIVLIVTKFARGLDRHLNVFDVTTNPRNVAGTGPGA